LSVCGFPSGAGVLLLTLASTLLIPHRAEEWTPARSLAEVGALMNSLQGADVGPTVVQRSAIASARLSAGATLARWNTMRTTELAALNVKLRAVGLPPISVE